MKEEKKALEVPVSVNVKDLKKICQKCLESGKKYFKYKSLTLNTEYAKYLVEYAEEKGKTSFRISQANLPKK